VRWSDELGPEEIAARHMSDADIVVCEGFKRSQLPKIEVFREGAHSKPLYDPTDEAARSYLAIVADTEVPGATVPVVRFDDEAWLDALADLVEDHIMNHRTQ
jgi:molybdopterin-guanine dinucleotide biosynthesis protein B